MSDIEKRMKDLMSESDIGIWCPITRERLRKKGIEISDPPELPLEESVDLLFSEASKLRALEGAKSLPVPPKITAPSIQSLYDEIRTAITLGLKGAAITLSGVLVSAQCKRTGITCSQGKLLIGFSST